MIRSTSLSLALLWSGEVEGSFKLNSDKPFMGKQNKNKLDIKVNQVKAAIQEENANGEDPIEGVGKGDAAKDADVAKGPDGRSVCGELWGVLKGKWFWKMCDFGKCV